MRRTSRSVSLSLGLAALCLAAVACGDTDDEGEVVVFAAASLTESFTELGDAFVDEHPDSSVTFNFAASSEVAAQINQGAPADVFASADMTNMDRVVDAGNNTGEPEVFVTNALEVIVESGNPHDITELADLENQDLTIVTCDTEVPIGAYTKAVFDKADIAVEPDSFEADVKAVANKVVLGEVDAGVVYATDVTAVGQDAAGVEIPTDVNVVAEYPIVQTADAPNPDGAEAFMDFVQSDQGQEILQQYGFTSP